MAIQPRADRYEMDGGTSSIRMWRNVLYRHGSDFLEFSKNEGEPEALIRNE
jgi:hypothetical protein